MFTPTILETLPESDTRIVSISCGYYHSALVSEKGELFTFGDGDGGKLGHGTESGQAQCNVPKRVNIKEKVFQTLFSGEERLQTKRVLCSL